MHKGSDKSAFKVSVAGKSTAPVDEIANFKSARYIGPHEACYHLFEFKMYSSSHSFERLSVHFVGNQSVVYNVEGEPVDVAPEVHHDDDEDDEEDEEDDSGSVDLNSGDEQSKKKGKYEPTGASKLLAYYAAVSAEVPDQKYKFGPRATDLRFIDFPQYYSYSNKEGWLRRSKRTYDRVCVRVHMVSMVNPELYYLRLLLLNVPGVKSEESLKDIHYNGVRSPTFHAACMAHGLAHDDKEWHLSMHEASKVQGKMGRALRILYSTIFAHCHPSDPVQLFHDFADDMCDDFTYARTGDTRGGQPTSEDRFRALKWIHRRLRLDLNQDDAKVLLLTKLMDSWDPTERAKVESDSTFTEHVRFSPTSPEL